MPTCRYEGMTLDGQTVRVSVAHDTISAIERIPASPELPLLAPPLVDLQHNGALGRAFNNLHADPGVLAVVASHVRRHGVGRMLATFTTYDYEKLRASLTAFDRLLKSDADLAGLYAGAFFEGLYMSPEYGWRGAHNPAYMRDPSWDEWRALQTAAGGRIRIFNVDPDRPGAIPAIEQAVRHGIRVAMGHCSPSPESIGRAVAAGADLVTHLGNGAPPEIHRHRNPFWTWLADDRITVGVIADGHHLPADVLRTVFKAKGRNRAYTVSDASEHSGMPPGQYGDVTIEPDGFCHMTGQEILSGAWHQADRCVERLCELGWSHADAWRQQSVVPAAVLGLPMPVLAPGARADFVLSTYGPDGLRLLQVVLDGRRRLDAPIHPNMP